MKIQKSLRKIIIISQFVSLIFLSFLSVSAAGEVDPAFNPGLSQMEYRSGSASKTEVRRVVRQPDGKVLIAGFFSAVGKFGRTGIARLNADGTVDTTFNAPEMLNISFIGAQPATILAVALQADGKILVGGNISTVAGVARPGIARLNSDGSLDPTFASAASYNFNSDSGIGTVSDIEVGADGKVTFGGTFVYNPVQNQKFNLARVFADGTLDSSLDTLPSNPSHNNWVTEILLVPGDKMMLFVGAPQSSSGNIYRLNANGSVDFSQPVGGVVQRFAVQSDGKILAGGSFSTFNGFPVSAGLVRLNTDGSFDTSFTPPNVNSIADVEVLSDGRILVGGTFLSSVILLNSNGTTDNSFNYTGTRIRVYDMAVQLDGRIVVGGQASEITGDINQPLVRLTAAGALDPIQLIVGNTGRANKIFIQPDGKILAAGFFTHADGAIRGDIVRFNADGTLDGSFVPDAFIGWEYFGLDIQSDGVILAATSNGFRKINPNGTTLFNSVAGLSYDIKPLPDGRLLVGLNNFLRLVNTNNTFDFSFNVPTNASLRRIIRQPDGKIIIAGYFTSVNSTSRSRIARLNADGTLDASFNPPGGTNDTITDIALQPDGKIIIVGPFTGVNFNTNYKFAARLNADGTLDTSFNPIINGEVSGLKLQPDGKILIGGTFTTVNSTPRNSMARLNSDGSLDPAFNLGSGTDRPIRTIELQAGNKILIGGEFTRVNGFDRLGLARLSNDSVLRSAFDYDGDGKADVSVYRPSTNRWYIYKSSDSTVSETTFGIAGDVPAPADFDGDGKTDIAIFRPSSGDWWSLSSSNSSQVFAHWGANGDIPRPSDFDGDGRADYVVFRPSDNFWYRMSSGNGASSNGAFGLAGDKPVTGDFDGDGKSDKAIFRASSGDWWYQSSLNGAQLATHWGISTDVPAPADYDGDGKTDFAVYRPSTGVWYIINSSNSSFTIMAFGISEDKPAPADYDGDGKADVAVFRPSTGTWYQMKTTAGFAAQQFGISTDIPTENAFVP